MNHPEDHVTVSYPYSESELKSEHLMANAADILDALEPLMDKATRFLGTLFHRKDIYQAIPIVPTVSIKGFYPFIIYCCFFIIFKMKKCVQQFNIR